MEVIAGSHRGVILEVIGAHEPKHLAGGRSMTWDAASRTRLLPICARRLGHVWGMDHRTTAVTNGPLREAKFRDRPGQRQ
jgi:hypothetical protein